MESQTVHVPLLSKPSINSIQLRLIIMSWIVNDSANTSNLYSSNYQEKLTLNSYYSDGRGKTDTQSTKINTVPSRERD